MLVSLILLVCICIALGAFCFEFRSQAKHAEEMEAQVRAKFVEEKDERIHVEQQLHVTKAALAEIRKLVRTTPL